MLNPSRYFDRAILDSALVMVIRRDLLRKSAAYAAIALTLVGVPIARAESITFLYAPFEIAPNNAWGQVSIALAPGAWRVGRVDGSPAREEQVRAVLENLTSITVGGRCTSMVYIRTSYPCGFAIADPSLGGIAFDRFTWVAAGWTGTNGISSGLDQEDGPSGSVAAFDDSATHSASSTSATRVRSPNLSPFVGLSAPERYLGDKRAAIGKSRTFRFRAVSNPIMPSAFDLKSGVVVMSATSPKVNQKVTHIGPFIAVDYGPTRDEAVLAYAIQSPRPARGAGTRDDDARESVDQLIGQWVEALNARRLDWLAPLYHPHARLFDGANVLAGKDPVGLRRHLERTARLSSTHAWKVVQHRTWVSHDQGTSQIAYEFRTVDPVGSPRTENGYIHFNLARTESRWFIVSHGPWTHSLLGP